MKKNRRGRPTKSRSRRGRAVKKGARRAGRSTVWISIALLLAAGAAIYAGRTFLGETSMNGKPRSAIINTSLGRIKCELFPDKAPKTVENFVGLAEGTKEWTDPRTGEKSKKRLYDGSVFHRVIPNFMIQGGDPLGTGTGGPGYTFEDEFDPDLTFDRPGRLAMANSGPNTNGSQFFITQVPTPWLDGHHTIFGQVVEGQEIVNRIATVPTGSNNKPLEPVVINTITIER